MQEIWKDIPGYEGLYQISNLGRVKSYMERAKVPGEIIKATATMKNGYHTTSLYKNGKTVTKLIHRMVAEAFVDNPYGYKEINHKDENKNNNCADNLEWCTRKYNQNFGSCISRGSEKQSKRILQFSLDGTFIGAYVRAHSIEKKLGLSRGVIGKCCRLEMPTAAGFVWRYAE